MKKGNAVFAFTLKNQEGKTETWHIDLKEKGEVVKGPVDKADGELLRFLPQKTRRSILLDFGSLLGKTRLTPNTSNAVAVR